MSRWNQRHYKRTLRSIIYIIITYTVFMYLTPVEHMSCFRSKIPSLENILTKNPEPGSFFLIDTSCDSFQVGRIVIAKRDACAVEALARLHPNKSIYLLYGSPGIFQEQYSESDRVLQALFTYNNIHVLHLDVRSFIKGTPAEGLVLNTNFMKSGDVAIHLNNILRLVAVWRYKGIYVDFDIIARRSFESLGDVFMTRETEDKVSNAVFGYSKLTPQNLDIISKALEIYTQEYKDNLEMKGEEVMTKLVKRLCKDVTDCGVLKIHPVGVFHPVERRNWEVLYKEIHTSDASVKARSSYGVRFWNLFSNNTKIPLEDDAYYLRQAFENCPRVIGQCQDDF